MSRAFPKGARLAAACSSVTAALLAGGDLDRAWAVPPPPSAPSSAGVAKPLDAPVKGSDIPANASPEPSASEWSSARTVSVSRGTLARSCTLELVREWLRITCAGAPGVGLVAGDPKAAHVSSLATPDGDKLTASIVLPVRPGEAFIASFLGTAPGYNAASMSEGAVVQVGWREGADDPLIIAYPPEPER